MLKNVSLLNWHPPEVAPFQIKAAASTLACAVTAEEKEAVNYNYCLACRNPFRLTFESMYLIYLLALLLLLFFIGRARRVPGPHDERRPRPD
jgi:hypothetical protein